MLAEPKFKLKWAEDPRNINWSKDTNKYGYKMLSKMGWSEGKGLGANENGIKSHVKVSKRKENLGLGASTFNDDNWLSHQDDFSQLLSKLNQKDSKGADDQLEQTSLQKNVQSSQRKILYTKFIKSKDLSLKSKNDLACIFGHRSKSTPATPQDLSEDEDSTSDLSVASCPASANVNEASQESFVTVKSEMNLQEYFAAKMAALQRKSEIKENGKSPDPKREPEGNADVTKKRKKAKKDRSEKMEYKEVKVKKDKKKKRNSESLCIFNKSDLGISERCLEGQTQDGLEIDGESTKMKRTINKAIIDDESKPKVQKKRTKNGMKLHKLQSLEKEGLGHAITEDDDTNSKQNSTQKEDQSADGCENISAKKAKKKKKKEKRKNLVLGSAEKMEAGKDKTFKTNYECENVKDAEMLSNDQSFEPRKKKKRKVK